MRITTPYPPQAALQGHGGLKTWPVFVAENLLARNFTLTMPNQIWTSDIPICGQMKAGCTLAIVRGLFNREIGVDIVNKKAR